MQRSCSVGDSWHSLREDEFLARHVGKTAEMQDVATGSKILKVMPADTSVQLPSKSSGEGVVGSTVEGSRSHDSISPSTRPEDSDMSEQEPKRKRAIDDEGNQDEVEEDSDSNMGSGTAVLSICESPVYGDESFHPKDYVELLAINEDLRGEWSPMQTWMDEPVGGHVPSDGPMANMEDRKPAGGHVPSGGQPSSVAQPDAEFKIDLGEWIERDCIDDRGERLPADAQATS